MARLTRYSIQGQVQHVIQRGNNRKVIFAHDQDYRFYLECLQDGAKRYGLLIHAYVLMKTNHVHLLCTPQTENSLSKGRGKNKLSKDHVNIWVRFGRFD